MSRPRGFKHTEETKERMRANHPHLMRSHTDEEKAKVSKAMREWHRTHPHPRMGKKASAETKRKMSLARQGSKNANWKGGLTELVKGIRRSPEFYQWRKAVLDRDKHTCQDCKTTENLDAHHIQSLVEFPEGIFDVDNGLTLCQNCHKRHSWWQRIKPKQKRRKLCKKQQ